MLKVIKKADAIKIAEYMEKKHMDYETARRFITFMGIENGTTIMHDAFPYMIRIIEKLYNPADYGKNGKVSEVEERLARWEENNRPCCRWHEMHAKGHGQSDMNSRKQEEMKTGAGDWLYSKTACTREEIISEYRHRQSLILWKTDEFTIRCTWEQLFDYMELYNDKGVVQFFKANTKFNPQVSKSVCMLQEWKTSKKKIAFFKACPYNMDEE